MRRSFLSAFAAAILALPGAARAQADDLQASYDFLLSGRPAGGVLFNFSNVPQSAPGTERSLASQGIPSGLYALPGSYVDTAAYWGAYVCAGARATCAVSDRYNALDYTLAPDAGAAGTLQVERVNAHNGANIYDMATWQIAVMLGAVKNHLRIASPTSAYAFASSPSEVLRQAAHLSALNAAPGGKRAVTTGKTFVYNGRVITEGAHAYAFRALAPEWLARDPLMDSPFASFVTASNLPASDRSYQAGKITWTDWKPITGENAWAFLIGPLQAAHLHYVVDLREQFIPFSDIVVQNALDLLPTFAAMQSSVGAVYYAPAGTVGNEGEASVNPHTVSVENNFSLYAGLQILRRTLRAEREDATLGADDKRKIDDALRLIGVMIDGGRIDAEHQTKGLLSFFKTAAWQNGAFVQGGLADDPAQTAAWVPAREPKAVDVQTWGIAALGAKQIDAWFGAGTAFALWQGVKTWGAYGVEKTLWGVGYSDQDGNGISSEGVYRHGVMSAEWTAGAINAVRNLIGAYGADAKYTASLREDEAAMLAALGALRIDRYAAAGFAGAPAGYANLVAVKTRPYLYASRRYHIPFGWYANPLPSTASTAWAIMIADGYDPFGIGGAPN